MTDADDTTRLEAALDRACRDLDQYCEDHPDEDVDEDEAIEACVRAIDAAVRDILAAPIRTLGDMRLHARALLEWYDPSAMSEDDGLVDLLEALEDLPERLWGEPIKARQ
jgi:hypothetical protein